MGISSYAKAINSVLASEMFKDENIIVMGQAVTTGGQYSQTEGLFKKFGTRRVIDTSINDDTTIKTALGSAMAGLKPIVFINSVFLLKTMDSIANEVAYTDFVYNSHYPSSMVICVDIAPSRANPPQLNFMYEAMFAHIPAIEVVYPSGVNEASSLMKEAIHSDKPVIFLMDKKLLLSEEDNFIAELNYKIGRAQILKEGDFATILSYGSMVKQALIAANKAQKLKLECEIIDLCSLKPLDKETIINSAKKTGRVIIAHEGYKTMGIGAEISALISESEAFDYLQRPIIRVAASDTPVGFSDELYDQCIPDWKNIYEAILYTAK